MSEGAARAFATQAAERSAGKALESLYHFNVHKFHACTRHSNCMYFTDLCLDRCDPRYQRELAEQAGARLASAAGSKAWSAVLPLVGAAISGAIEGASAGWFASLVRHELRACSETMHD